MLLSKVGAQMILVGATFAHNALTSCTETVVFSSKALGHTHGFVSKRCMKVCGF